MTSREVEAFKRLLVPSYPGFCMRGGEKKERMPHTVKSGVLGPKENNMSTGAGLARNLCSQTSQTFTLSICMFFPLCPVESVLSDGAHFSLTNFACGLPAGCIPLEIFHLKLITIARCGVVPRVEFLLTSRRVHIKQPRIFVNRRVVQLQSSNVRGVCACVCK